MSIFQSKKYICTTGGFTLIEVLIVVLIAVIVTMFAVPAYQKMQERNQYLAASSIVEDLGNGINMLREKYPDLSLAVQPITSTNASVLVTAEVAAQTPTANNLIGWLRANDYISQVPAPVNGYAFSVKTTGNACKISSWGTDAVLKSACGTQWANAVACAFNTSSKKCSWVDFSGIMHNN